MTQNFTPEELIAYLYSETSASKTLAIEEARHQDPVFDSEIIGFLNAKRQLPRVRFNAPKRAINSILKHSRTQAVEQQA